MNFSNKLFSIEDWKFRFTRRAVPLFRKNWPTRTNKTISPTRVAIVTVNYNTKELLARLIFSLRRFVNQEVVIGPIVVVDNNSKDGSVEMITELTQKGIIFSILNKRQAYHGPGLNQGMELLRMRAASGEPEFAEIDYVFIVDSDVFICRNEVFSDAIKAMQAARSPLSGEFFACEDLPGGYAHVSSMLFDPATTWRRGFLPFEEHGVPALEFQRTITDNGLIRFDFPYRSHFYLIHLWSGTLKVICSSNESNNKYFEWATTDIPSRASMDDKEKYIIAEFEECYRRFVPTFDISAVVEACSSNKEIHLKRPYELIPNESFMPSGIVSEIGLVAYGSYKHRPQ
jgi:glycosyltransferase involved in cell wall biosynthesis